MTMRPTTRSVGAIFHVLGGGTPSTANPDFWKGPIPWATSADLDDNLGISPRKTISRTAVEASATNLVPTGSVVVATRVGLGKVGIAPTDICFSQDCHGLILDPKICDSKFAALQLKLRVQKFKHISRGTTIAGVTKKQLLDVEFDLPPLKQQRGIVTEVEKQFTRLEAGVTALRRVQANLKRYRAAVLKAACEGRLVPTEAELAKAENRKFETGEELLARILTERRHIHERAQASTSRKKKYNEPKPPNIQAAEQLPDGWTWTTWDQIGFSQNGRPFPSAEYQAAGIRLLRPGNLHVRGKVVWTEENTRCMPQKFAGANPDLLIGGGELVMNLTAQSLKDEFLGRVCVTDHDEECLLNQRVARLTPVFVPPQFVLYLLKSWRFRRYVDGLNSGSLIQHMFTLQLAEFTFPLPPLAEQTRIVAEVERRLSVVEELEEAASANLQRATGLRRSVLQDAFSPDRLKAEPI
jgi:type I restriction enzyme S subunit